jgi:hypothetical protein
MQGYQESTLPQEMPSNPKTKTNEYQNKYAEGSVIIMGKKTVKHHVYQVFKSKSDKRLTCLRWCRGGWASPVISVPVVAEAEGMGSGGRRGERERSV